MSLYDFTQQEKMFHVQTLNGRYTDEQHNTFLQSKEWSNTSAVMDCSDRVPRSLLRFLHVIFVLILVKFLDLQSMRWIKCILFMRFRRAIEDSKYDVTLVKSHNTVFKNKSIMTCRILLHNCWVWLSLQKRLKLSKDTIYVNFGLCWRIIHVYIWE